MTNVNDLKIKFLKKLTKRIYLMITVNIIFFNKKRKISYIPKKLGLIIKDYFFFFLEKSVSSKNIKNLTLFRCEFGSFIIILENDIKAWKINDFQMKIWVEKFTM